MKKLFCSRRNKPETLSAGCFFTDGRLYLAGYQPMKKKPCISGIGGHMEEGETELQTAIRELIEELFEINPVPKSVQKDIEIYVAPQKIVRNLSYTIFQYSFNDLETILKLMKQYDLKSPLYNSFPLTVADLVFHRLSPTNTLPEISHLVILPFVKNKNLICPFLLSDICKLQVE